MWEESGGNPSACHGHSHCGEHGSWPRFRVWFRAFLESLRVMSNHLFLLMPTMEDGCWLLLRLTDTHSPVRYSISKHTLWPTCYNSFLERVCSSWGHSLWKAGVISLPRGTWVLFIHTNVREADSWPHLPARVKGRASILSSQFGWNILSTFKTAFMVWISYPFRLFPAVAT